MAVPGVLETLESFPLEKHLTFDVSKTKHGICGMLCEKRWSKEKSDHYWSLFYFSPAQWRKFQANTAAIDECLSDKDYLKEFVIGNEKIVTLSALKDEQFLRFIVVTLDGEVVPAKSITITANAWAKIKLLSYKINSLLPQKRKLCFDEDEIKEKQKARLSLRYRYICTRSDGQLSGDWYFLRAQAMQAMIDNNLSNESNVQIQKQWVSMPKNESILKQCFIRLLCDNINKLIDSQECEGCKIDHPSQTQHMGPGGCLEIVTSHETALEMLDDGEVNEVYKNLQSHLKLHDDAQISWMEMNVCALRKCDLTEEIETCLNCIIHKRTDDDGEVTNCLNTAIEYLQKRT
ncbi:unnamed protein product [Owenia fusiformis]|uniref:Uncharacterized protein n=1 Tax=Owenia fusiformis TaxID=6347 RepID=A0A8J1USL2_OWEFU|nr:unnamed protein product [Owenia fusiformis]